MSYADLGPFVGLSPAAARQRVLNLIDDGTMQIVAVTDPTRLGFEIQAMVGLEVTGDLQAAAQRIAQITSVDYLVITTGRFDMIAEVVAVDTADFISTLGQIRAIDGVISTEAFTYLALEKQSYDWGVR
jgi:Lrp/AsnC family transcriptional regulator for asnA, asnC and gidA